MCEARLTHSEVEAEHLLHIVSVVVQQLLQTPGQGGGKERQHGVRQSGWHLSVAILSRNPFLTFRDEECRVIIFLEWRRRTQGVE